MKNPKQIKYRYSLLLIAISDILIALLLILFLKLWDPELEVVIPKMIYKPLYTPMWLEICIYVCFWFLILSMSGSYRQLRQKAFIQYYTRLAVTIFIGHVFFTFFFFTKNNSLYIYGFYHFFFQLFALTILAFSLPRFIYFNIIYWKMKRQKIAVYALLIGNSTKAESVYFDFVGYDKLINYHFIGFVETNDLSMDLTHLPIQKLGNLDYLQKIIETYDIDEVIVAIEDNKSKDIQRILNVVKQKDIVIRLLPDLNAIMEGTVKMSNVKGIPLITIRNDLMPVWQASLKTILDYTVSIFALIIFLPVLPFIVIGIISSSKGPIFYTQTRIGKNRKPFKMIKFRSMYVDSEMSGPALASSKDPRITPFGRILRRWHIDELPQFINVIKGDMSLVGPRPERQHYIDQLLPVAPYYSHLFRIKPGITSWGMVKYGYAENVEQMVERLKFDILYLENMSLLVDLKIILHTLRSVLVGDGK